jgi:TP901 family phage tail tape measure protein
VAQSVGSLNVELSADASKLKQGVAQAVKTIDQLGQKFDELGQDATAGMAKAERAVTKVAQETKQSLTKVENAYQKAAYGVDDFALAYHEMARKVANDSKRITQAAEGASRVGNKFTDMGSKMTSVGTKMSMALTAPMLLAGGQAIKTANDFEFSMQSIVAMVGLSENKVAEMGLAAREMAKEFGGSAVDAADALYFVASAGIDGATAMQVLESSLKASAIGMGQTAIVADTISSALNAYGAENLSAAQATDLMVAAVREGKMEADSLAGALPRVLPIASAMGVTFEEVGAAFAAMSRNGTDASEAATQIRGILASLLNPAKQAEEQLNALGLSGAGLREQIKQKGLLSALQTLTAAFGDNEEAQGIVFGNIRALTGVMSLFGAATDSTAKIFANLTDNSGDADKAFEAMSKTGAFKMKQVMAEMKDAFISLGQVLVPIVVPALKMLATAFEKVMTAINALPNFLKTIIVVLAGLVAVGGPLLIMLGSLAKAWAALKAAMATQAFTSAIAQFAAAGPIIAGVAVAVIAIAAVWYTFSQNAKEAKERQERLTDAFKAAGEPTAVLHDEVKGLVDEYIKLQGALPATAQAAANVATAFATAESVTLGINDEISNLNLTMEQVGGVVSTGTDAFGDLGDVLLGLSYDQLVQTGDAAISVSSALQAAADAGTPFAGAMLEAVKAGEMTGNQVKDLLYNLDDLSNAFDDNREALDSENKKLLQSADTALYFSSILGTEMYNAILGSGAAMAAAAGRTDIYTFTLQELQNKAVSVTAAQDAFLGGLAGVFPQAVTVAGNKVAELADIYAELAKESDKGTVAQDAFLAKIGLLDEMLANELVVSTQDAIDKNIKLADTLGDSKGSALDLSSAYRNQAKEITTLLLKTAQYGGSNKDAMQSVALMVLRLGDAARAAGYTDEEVRGLIDSMGILDGLEAEFGVNFAINTADLDKQIANVQAAIGNMLWAAGAATGDTTMRLSKTLSDLKAIRSAIGTTGGSPTGRGGGGGGGSTKTQAPNDLAAFVENMVNDLAGYANELMSTDFRDALLYGSSKEIGKALQATLDEAVRLGLDKLPQFAGFIDKIKAQFARLSNMADVRDVLTTQLADATKALEEFKSTLEEVQVAAGKFDATITGSTAPSNTLLDQALAAQKQYDELFAKSESLKQQQSDLAKSVSDSVVQPITAKNPLGNARKMLAEATTFRDNLTSLRDAGFGSDIIAQVAQAGVLEGNKIAKSLLSMSAGDIAELLNVRSQISAIATESGALVGEVVFGADIAGAESALATQNALVRQLFTDAVAQAQAQFEQQQTLVNGLESSLESVSTQMAALVTAIQVDLHDTMFTFLAGFQGGIDKLTTPVAASAYSNFTAGQQTNLADGALANGGAIVGGIYLPPGIDFSGFHSQGGIAMKPSIGVIGESGPEAIIPLSQMNNYGGGGDTYVTVNVNGSVTSERNLVEAVRVGLLKIQKSGRTTTI